MKQLAPGIGMMVVMAVYLACPLLLMGWFYTHQSELAARYCVNQSRPELHCDGQCYLARQIGRVTVPAVVPAPVPALPPVPAFLPLAPLPQPVLMWLNMSRGGYPHLWAPGTPVSGITDVFRPPEGGRLHT